MQDLGRYDNFPDVRQCTPWYFKKSTGKLLKCAIKVSSAKYKKNNFTF